MDQALTGPGSGALVALWRTGEQPSEHVILEALGGCLGGLAGSRLPDIFDPPTNPNHRSMGHGLLTTGCVGKICLDKLTEWQTALRATADRLAAERSTLANDAEHVWSQLLEWLCRVAAGAICGIAAGYASHLILDFATPKGLPLVTRGC